MSVVITTTSTPDGAIVRIAGRLEAPDLPELRRVLEGRTSPVELDLSQLMTADVEAIAFIRRCRGAGATLSHASPYVSLLLGDETELEAEHPPKNRSP